MKRLAALFLLFGVAARAPAPEVRRLLGFHWGDVGGNTTLLSFGGYGDQEGRTRELNPGRSATLGPAVMRQIASWYREAGAGDRAGAGFYFSTDLFDSIQFGSDLLIVEATGAGARGIEAVRVEAEAFKTAADAALAAGTDRDLPLVARYERTWHSIPRVPDPARDGDVTIVFRSPTAEDVPAIFEWLAGGKPLPAVAGFLSGIASAIEPGRSREPMTRVSEIVFHRLLFDLGFEALAGTPVSAAPAITDETWGQLLRVFRAFKRVLPADPRTARLAEHLVELVRETVGGRELPDARVRDLAALAPSLPRPERTSLSRWLPALYPLARIDTLFPETLGLYDLLYDRFPPPLRSAWMTQMERALREGRAAPPGDEATFRLLLGYFAGMTAFRGVRWDIDRQFSRYLSFVAALNAELTPEGRAFWEGSLRAAARRASTQVLVDDAFVAAGDTLFGREWVEVTATFHVPRRFRVGETDAGDALAALERRYGEVAIGTVIAIVDRIGASGENDDRTGWTEHVLEPFLWHLYHLPEGEPKSRWIASLQASYRRYRSRWSSRIGWFERQPRHRSPAPGEYDAYCRWVATHFPDLARSMISQLKHASPLVRRHVDATSLLADLKRILPPRDWRAELVDQYEEEFPEGGPVTREAYVAANRRALDAVQGSQQYSELMQTFLLVDPILVSEDVRPPIEGRLPFRRFNELQRASSGAYRERPAWENFLVAWEKLSLGVWPRESYLHSRTTMNRARLVRAIALVWGESLANGVDGTPMRRLMGPGGGISVEKLFYAWDRKKYRTPLDAETWRRLGAEGSMTEIGRFFDVEEGEGGGKILTFKTAAALRESFPGLGDHLDATPSGGRFTKSDSYGILHYIVETVYAERDPLLRAATILHLVPKLHPFENGNGRLARLWAAIELVHAGFPIPVGFPTNDFLMTRERLLLEVRRAVRLGKLWADLVARAHADGVPADEFFQSRFRGSPFEGLLHLTPAGDEAMRRLVAWLEAQSAPPAWGAILAREVERRIGTLRARHGAVAATSESERHLALDETWIAFAGQLASGACPLLLELLGATDTGL